MYILSKTYFHDEEAAFKFLVGVLWPRGPICPHCGGAERFYDLSKTRMGLWKCGHCRKQFTVRVGMVFESSHVPLHKWLQAAYLLCSSKKGISSHQLHFILEITYKAAWFMTHRLREAMRDGELPPLGGEGEIVQADETYFGGKDRYRGKPWAEKKGHVKLRSVVSLVSGGKARTFHVARADAKTVREILVTNVRRETEPHTDESRLYIKVGREFAAHRAIVHSRGENVKDGVTTNNVENYFSIFKRGMKGIYQHCSERHLHRYLAEFDFRYNERENTDLGRAAVMLEGIVGKRLMYNPVEC